MAQMDTRQRTGRTLLEGGGVPGALLGGLLGGDKSVASGYETVARLRGLEQGMRLTEDDAMRREETHQADLASRYADLQMKSRELQIRDMEIGVMEQAQAGKLAEAQAFSTRMKNRLDNVEMLTEQDKTQMITDSVTAMAKLDDASRAAVASLAKGVVDQRTHDIAYRTLERTAQAANSTVEEMYPGMTKEWEGDATKQMYAFYRDAASSSQKVLETERINIQANEFQRETDERRNEYDIEGRRQQFGYDLLLQNMALQAKIDAAEIKAKGNKIKRSDLESMAPGTIASSLAIAAQQFTGLQADSEEVQELTNQLAVEVSKEFDKEWTKYVEGTRPTPPSQGELIQQKMNTIQSRVGTDGELYEESDPKLERQANEWKDIWISKALTIPDFAVLPEDVQRAYADAAWASPEARTAAEFKR